MYKLYIRNYRDYIAIITNSAFYLLTLYCFSKGSQRLHQWFRQTDLYKKHLADFVQKRTMSIKAKFKVFFMVTVIMSIGYYFMPAEFFWVQYVMITVWIIHIIYLFWGIKQKNIDENKNKRLKLASYFALAKIILYLKSILLL